MRSTVLKTIEEEIPDPIEFSDEMLEMKRRRVAEAANAACNLPGNDNGPDLEEFAAKYGKKSSFA